MKRHTISMKLSVLLLTIILLPASVFGQDTPSLTGAGQGDFVPAEEITRRMQVIKL